MIDIMRAQEPEMVKLVVLKIKSGKETGWIVPAAGGDTSGLAALFVEGDEADLRTKVMLPERFPIVEVNVTSVGFRQLRGQAVWRELT